MPGISVIVPAHNAQRYIGTCLDSIVGQTMRDIEVVVVDDGSTDSTLLLCKSYAKADARITVLSQSNGGAGTARNAGLAAATGDYVLFLDADDFFEPNLCELLYGRAVRTGADIVICEADIYFEDKDSFSPAPWVLNEPLLPDKDVFSRADLPDDIFSIVVGGPCNKLFRRQLIVDNGVDFPELASIEDVPFVYTMMALAERIAVVTVVLQHYRRKAVANDSLSFAVDRHPVRLFDSWQVLRQRLEGYHIFDAVEYAFINRYIRDVVDTYDYKLNDATAKSIFCEAVKRLDQELAGIEHIDRKRINDKGALRLYEEIIHAAPPSYDAVDHTRPVTDRMGPAVSVIVPVYNAERYLEAALGSVLAQSLADIEVICVDDGSTDDSGTILDALAARDPRVRVVHKENGGQSSARNVGIELARGAYVYFFDSDDLLDCHALERLCARADRFGLDLLLFNGGTFYDTPDLEKLFPQYAMYYQRSGAYPELAKGRELFAAMEAAGEYRVSPCLQFIRRSYLQASGITFREGIIHEDNLFSFFIIMGCERAGYLPAVLFQRRVRAGSTMTASSRNRIFAGYCTCCALMSEYVDAHALPLDVERACFGQIRLLYANMLDVYDGSSEEQGSLISSLVGECGSSIPTWVRASLESGLSARSYVNGLVRRNPKVSVVMPVFNVAPFLPESLASLSAQTLDSFEVICVDDGSTDDSAGIVERYCAQDSRFLLLHQENRGAGAARNHGIEVACGRYLICLDPDDVFEPDYLEALVTRALETDAEVCIATGDTFDNATGEHRPFPTTLHREMLPANEVFSGLDVAHDLFQFTSGCPWNKLYLRTFVEELGIRYQPLPRANDLYFTYCALAQARRIAVLEDHPYVHYRTNVASSLQRTSDRTPTVFLDAFLGVRETLVSLGKFAPFVDSFGSAVVSNALGTLMGAVRQNGSCLAIRSRLMHEVIPLLRADGFTSAAVRDRDQRFLYRALTGDCLRSGIIRQSDVTGLSDGGAPALSEERPLASIVVPVYNSAPWLEACLDSALGQTLGDIEVICIDDGSTDGSPEILERFQNDDPRVVAVHQENGGLSAARNTGIELARGAYVLFLDSDDVLRADAIEHLYKHASDCAADVVFFSARCFAEDEGRKSGIEAADAYFNHSIEFCQPVSGEELFITQQREGDFCASACLQLINRQFLLQSGVRFRTGIIAEDELFTLQLALKAKRVCCLNNKLYLRRIRSGSITTGASKLPHLYSIIEIRREFMRMLAGSELSEDARTAVLFRLDNAIARNLEVDFAAVPQQKLGMLRVAFDAEGLDLYNLLLAVYGGSKSAAAQQAERSGAAPQASPSFRPSYDAQRELELVKASASFKIGHTLTWPARKARTLIRCVREHGARETWRIYATRRFDRRR